MSACRVNRAGAPSPRALRRALQRVYPDSDAPAIRRGSANGHTRPTTMRSRWPTKSCALPSCDKPATFTSSRARDRVRVRLRVDGQLEEFRRLPATRQAGLILAGSRFSAAWTSPKSAPPRTARSPGPTAPAPERRTVDIRVATVPVKYGERMTLRLLNLQTGALDARESGHVDGRICRPSPAPSSRRTD